MRVKDITGRNHNVKPENVRLHYEKARGLTYWCNNYKTRLNLTDEQKQIVKNVVKDVFVFNGYGTKIVPLADLQYERDD